MDDEPGIDINIPGNIPNFYKGKTVLITGFTGTIGKLIVEKLLYSCPEIKKIFVIVRSKRGKHVQERVEEAIQSLAFSRLRDKYPGQWESKIVAIAGDMLEDNLGLSEEDENILKEEVEILFHGAASVRFDDPLNVAVKQNTIGAKKVVDLALKLRNLISFVYISTAYTNCDYSYIKEEMYPPKADWKELAKIVTKINPATIQIVHPKIINGLPNTYVFSKSLAEQIINDSRNELPVIIVRPSIVVPAYKEPHPGWTDNKYGPLSLVIGFLFGILRCSWVKLDEKCNYIHSDVCVNATLVAAWEAAFTLNPKKIRDSVTVYNMCEPLENSMTHREFSMLYKNGGTMEEMNKDGINFVSQMYFASRFWYKVHVLYRHALPAFVIDRILVLLKKKPMLLLIKIKVLWATISLHYFTSRTFVFETKKFDNLKKLIKPEDVNKFSWEFKKGSFEEIFISGYLLHKKVLMKPIYDDLDTNRKRLRMLYIVDRSAVYFVHGLILWMIYKFSIPQLIISSLISFFTLPS